MARCDSEERHDRPDFGVFDTPIYVPGGIMKCPTCAENTPDAWKPLIVECNAPIGAGMFQDQHSLDAPPSPFPRQVALDWMRCANESCGELVIRVHETYRTFSHGLPISTHTDSWLARPRWTSRPVSPLVPSDLRRDYEEASAILDTSPRMSSVLSRRILADVLERYAKLDDFSLTKRINTFIADTAHPSSVRENLHHLREVADFSAHTQKNDQAQILDVGRDEADWTLDVIERLFDYFIVAPERDRRMREGMAQRIKEAGRKKIPPLPDAEGT